MSHRRETVSSAMRDLDHFGRRQHGLVSSGQLLRAGWTRSSMHRAVRIGRLIPVRRGVYRLAGAPITREQTLLAAVMAVGDGAVLSHASACSLWGLRHFPVPESIDILVIGQKAPRMPGVSGHVTCELPASHRTRRLRIPVTTPERTLIDCCGMVPPPRLSSAVNDCLRRKLVTLPRLARTVDEVPVSGRRKVVPIIDVLRSKIVGFDPGDSDPEVDLAATLVATGFPKPQQQIRVVTETGPAFIDVGWVDLRVGFEYDSLDYHLHAFHEDRDRLRRLKRAGWDVWPITKTTTKNEILAIASLAFSHERAVEREQLGKSGELRGLEGRR